jgi:hypothetical protein
MLLGLRSLAVPVPCQVGEQVAAFMKSWRHSPLPPGWYRTRLRIFKRDGYRCTHIRYDTGTRCPEEASHCDHVDPLGPDTDDNLTSLCPYHHKQKSSAEGGSAVHQKAKASNKKPPHPGVIRP